MLWGGNGICCVDGTSKLTQLPRMINNISKTTICKRRVVHLFSSSMTFIRLRFCRFISFKSHVVLGILGMVLTIYVLLSTLNGEYNKGVEKAFDAYDVDFFPDASQDATRSYDKQICIHPKLEINDPVMMKFYKKMRKVICKGDPNWVYVENGTLRFSKEALHIHGRFHCDYYPLIRGPGDYKYRFGRPLKKIRDGRPLVSDFFKVICKGKKSTYKNIHAGVHVNATIQERLRTVKPPANGLGLSIAFVGFDSMSRMSWLRRLPKTRDYMVNELKAIELEGYNNMGDGTPAALFPILTGQHEQELPESRRNFRGAKPVDDYPWLWKDFSKNGYVTSWADAEIGIAPFNYRLLGFNHAPADYFMRPFYLAVDPTYKRYSSHCHGSEPKHIVWLNWIRDLFYMYKHHPKFLFHFYTPLSHDDNNKITMADEDIRKFVAELHTDGYLNNTVLILASDHGARFANVRATLSGKLEERLPYISLVFPPWFEKKYPDLIKNVKINAHRLTTAMDLHETFKDFLRFDGTGLGDTKKRGISLFKEIPKSRTCAQADVAPHWCACLAWKNVSMMNKDVRRALQTAVATLNYFTDEYRSDCALLSVGTITMLSKMITSDDVLKFKQTKDDRGLVPQMSDNHVINEKILYQLTFFVEPGHGEFEITVEYVLGLDKMTVNPTGISRINKYGNSSACILHKNREIRQYCYCKKNLIESSDERRKGS